MQWRKDSGEKNKAKKKTPTKLKPQTPERIILVYSEWTWSGKGSWSFLTVGDSQQGYPYQKEMQTWM